MSTKTVNVEETIEIEIRGVDVVEVVAEMVRENTRQVSSRGRVKLRVNSQGRSCARFQPKIASITWSYPRDTDANGFVPPLSAVTKWTRSRRNTRGIE